MAHVSSIQACRRLTTTYLVEMALLKSISTVNKYLEYGSCRVHCLVLLLPRLRSMDFLEIEFLARVFCFSRSLLSSAKNHKILCHFCCFPTCTEVFLSTDKFYINVLRNGFKGDLQPADGSGVVIVLQLGPPPHRVAPLWPVKSLVGINFTLEYE